MSEHQLQGRLTWLGLASLASTPFTGPVGLLGAAAIFSGKALRPVLNVTARRNYREEKQTKKSSGREVTRVTPTHVDEYGMPESPGTAIARRNSVVASQLLDRDSRRRHYVEGLRQGATVAETYLEGLPPSEYSRVKQINIFPEVQSRILGIPIGKRSLEVQIKR